MAKKNNDLQTFNFRGIITGTSNKQNEEFNNERPRKTCYIKVDEMNKQILLENGLKEYTSEEKENFFIIKLSGDIKVWTKDGYFDLDSSIKSENFQTSKEVNIACIVGKNKGNQYVRIFALGVESSEDIEIIEVTNPFI